MNQQAEFVYVGFWARLWASLIDSVLLAMVIVPVLWAAYGWGYFDAYIEHYRQVLGGDLLASAPAERGPLDPLMTYGFPAVAVLVFWVYRSATPGKMAIHARIVDARTGAQPTTVQLVGRYLGYFVSTIPLGLGLLWVAFDPRKQGWHDKLAGTVVVRAEAPGRRRIRLVPPAYFLIALVLQVVLDRLAPVAELLAPRWRWLGLLCIVPAVLLAGPGARALVRQGTTLHPFGEPTRLVTAGPYRYSRNPLYLGLAALLLGVAVWLGSLAAFLVVPLFAWAVTAAFIRREEAVLAAAFGSAYREYCQRVRRWL